MSEVSSYEVKCECGRKTNVFVCVSDNLSESHRRVSSVSSPCSPAGGGASDVRSDELTSKIVRGLSEAPEKIYDHLRERSNLGVPPAELLPCPFCGGDVEFDDPECYVRGVGYHVECDKCYLRMWAFKVSESRTEHPSELAKRWNLRAGQKDSAKQSNQSR